MSDRAVTVIAIIVGLSGFVLLAAGRRATTLRDELTALGSGCIGVAVAALTVDAVRNHGVRTRERKQAEIDVTSHDRTVCWRAMKYLVNDGATSRGVLAGREFERVNWADADLGQANLRASSWSKSSLRRATLARCDLTECHLGFVDLREAVFSASTMVGADIVACDAERTFFIQADLTDALVRVSTLKNARFDRAKLDGVAFFQCDLTGANITNEQLASLAGLLGTILPDGTLYDGRFNLPGDMTAAREEGIITAEQQRTWFTKHGDEGNTGRAEGERLRSKQSSAYAWS